MILPRFELTISHDEDGSVRIAATGPAGTASIATPLPVPDVAAEAANGWDEAKRLGAALFAFAFPPAIDDLLEESRHRAEDAPVTIALDVAGDLATLPWELLYDPEIERFLVLSSGTPLTRAHKVVPEASPPEHANLRVRIVAPIIDEAVLAASEVLAPDPRVDVSAGTPAAPPRRRSHVVILRDGLDPETAIPVRTPVAILSGCLADGQRACSRARTVVVLPPTIDVKRRDTFLRALLTRLALGDTIETATVAGRRATASEQDATPADWAGPVLLTTTLPGTVVEPEEISTILGRRVMEHTVSWVQDALSGVVTSAIVFLVGLVLFRLGFSSSNSFELDILSPISLYQSFSALMIELSNYRQALLLVVSGILATATAIVAYLWWRNRVIDPEEATGLVARFAGPLSRLRTLTFLAVATLTVLGSYGYQQYLWRVKLPIPGDALGLAVTRAGQSDDFQQRLKATLADPGSVQSVVVRELPVEYDAGDIDTARQVGKRIGAEAVIVYRTEEREGQTGFVAYLVFTEPRLGRTFLSRTPTVLTGANPAPAPATTRIQEGIAVPILRASSLDALAEAGAGLVDYQAGRIDRAIAHLERARASGIGGTDAGLVDFYLASAYALDDRSAAARTTYTAAATAYEERATTERLGPQDELVLVTTYLALGNLSREAGDWPTALQWLHKAIAHRDELLARATGVDRPSDVNEVYARVYGELATVNQATGDREEELFWAKRTDDELQTLAAAVADTDRTGLVRLSATRLAVGDCIGAVDAVNGALAIAPGDADALLNAAAIAYLQSDVQSARNHLTGVPAGDPLGVRAHDALGLLSTLAAIDGFSGYAEPTFLADTRAILEPIASPSTLALQELGAAGSWQGASALQDLTALYGGDAITAAKSRVEWSTDPVRRQTAIDAYSHAITRLTELAARRPGDPTVATALTSAYAGRMSAFTSGQDAANAIADAEAVRVWADKVLAEGSGATRRDRLAAWALSLEALNELARLDANPPSDVLLRSIERATNEAQSAAPADDLEASAVRAIYDEVIHYATTVAANPEQAAQAQTARASVAGPSPVAQSLLRTVCQEERDRLAGDALLAAGDAAGAQTSYESALATNPRYAPALIGLSAARERQDDFAGAVTHATTATEVAPSSVEAWINLGVAQLAEGNAPQRDAALDRFFALTSEQPDQVRTSHLRLGIARVRDLLDRRPNLAVSVREVIPRFQAALDRLPDDGGYQLAARYAELGSLALTADDAATAEALLRRSLELDPHQAPALTDLATSELVQGRDASAEIAAALGEPDDPLWSRAGVEKVTLLTRMKARLDDYTRRFPDRARTLAVLIEPVTTAHAALASPAVPAETDPLAETYESTIFGFSLTMTGDWTILQSFPQESLDGVLLSNGVSLMYIIVIEMPGKTPAQCLQQELDALAADPDVSDFRPMTDADGTEIRGDSPDLAFAAYRFTSAEDDNMAPDRVAYTSCQPYPSPDAMLVVQHITPAESYAEQVVAREALLANLVLSET